MQEARTSTCFVTFSEGRKESDSPVEGSDSFACILYDYGSKTHYIFYG